MIREAIRKTVDRLDLTDPEAAAVFDEIMGGDATPAQIAAFITALRIKGETPAEIAAGARSMRAHATRVPTRRTDVIDTCGTGGDGAGTVNISSMAALVAAGAGAAVAKHGNRSVSSRCGSADLFRELGVVIDLDADAMGHCLDEAGIAFLFAPRLHPAMRHAIGPRREIGIRTIFNILGPLTNPAGASRCLLGVYSADLLELVAKALRELGADHALVVHGADGLDEISLSGPTRVAEVRSNTRQIEFYEIQPRDFGMSPVPTDAILGGEPAANAQCTLEVLGGAQGPVRNVVVANAAAALVVAGRAPDLRAGVPLAQQAIDDGAALAALDALRRVSAESAPAT